MDISEHNKLSSINDIRNFMFGGRAEFTLHSLKTDKHFTYRITGLTEDPKHPIRFVSFLNGGDNETDYLYAGLTRETIDRITHFKFTAKSPSINTPAINAYRWFIHHLNKNKIPDNVEFMHCGKCSACGRKLTTPASIARGMGEICWSRL